MTISRCTYYFPPFFKFAQPILFDPPTNLNLHLVQIGKTIRKNGPPLMNILFCNKSISFYRPYSNKCNLKPLSTVSVNN